MGRISALSLLFLAGLLASCAPAKAPVPPAPTGQGPVTELPPTWVSASLLTEDALTPAQKERVARLEPAGGEGRVGLGFTEDFDGDGRVESVAYGTYAKASETGNFVLVTRQEGSRTVVLLRQELPGPPRFTVFTLKPDGSLWFGGGIDAGEVTMNITWSGGLPVFHHLTEE
jgi:hypothetical protein